MEDSWKMQKCCFGKNIDSNWLYYYVRQAKVIIIINSCLLEYMNPSLINNYYAFNNGLIIIQNLIKKCYDIYNTKGILSMNNEVSLMYLF